MIASLPAFDAALPGLVAAFAVMAFVWALSVPLRNAAIIDVFWSICVAVAGVAFAVTQPPIDSRNQLVLALVALWAVRLAAFLFVRWRGEPEDRRYRVMREKWNPGFWWKSLFIVFTVQALLAWIVALPLLGIAVAQRPIGVLDAAGAALCVFGLIYEAIADRQLHQFRASASETDVLNTGLWRYSRHPNYFGELCFWWGIYVIAVSAGAWWTAIGPVIITLFIVKVSGIALTERTIGDRRPAYRDYIRTTSALWPRRPRR